MHTATFDGEQACLLQQADNFFALACTNKALAGKVHDITGEKLQLPNEEKPPFSKMGLTSDFNGIDVSQTKNHVELSCATHIDLLVTSQGWKEDRQIKDVAEMIAPLNKEMLKQVCKQKGPLGGTAEHKALEEKNDFGRRILSGKMMRACVACRPDAGRAIMLLWKFGSSPSAHHCTRLKNIATCLQATKCCGE